MLSSEIWRTFKNTSGQLLMGVPIVKYSVFNFLRLFQVLKKLKSCVHERTC